MPQALTRLIQLTHPEEGRRAALVDGNEIHLLATYRSVYAFALAALETGWKLRDLLSTDLSGIVLDRAEIYSLSTPWRFLPCFDHPMQPGRCLVSAEAAGGGWHYKGSGTSLRAHGDPVPVRRQEDALLALAEIAAVYVIGRDGAPRRVGVAAGLDLLREELPGVSGRARAPRNSSLGSQLILETCLPRVDGFVELIRSGRAIRREAVSSGELPLALALESVEPGHFQSLGELSPGDAQIHFLGRTLFENQPGLEVQQEDEIAVELTGFGPALHATVEMRQPAASMAAPL